MERVVTSTEEYLKADGSINADAIYDALDGLKELKEGSEK